MGASFTDFQWLTNADDRADAVGQSCLCLRSNQLIRLVVVLAALGVSNDNPRAVQLGKHACRNFTGVRTGLVLGDVLSTESDLKLVALNESLDGADVSERNGDCNVNLLEVFLWKGECKLLNSADCLLVIQVHLPVTSDKWLTCHG